MFAQSNADLSIAALSDRMGMSPRSFSRRIQKEVGETPAHFVERVRAEAARCKLEQTTSTVERIAVECGVKDPERMRRAFERVYSTTPSEYRGRFRSTLPS
jgi:transcriptional regulator GlxA family with amidase domain